MLLREKTEVYLMTRSMISEANLNQKFWGQAIHTATYLQTSLPTRANNTIPYELWTKGKPNFQHLRDFGCKAFAYVNKQH